MGQMLWKIGLNQVQLHGAGDFVLALFNKYIFIGLIIYVIDTFLWFYILKNNDLSKVYPLQSMSYIIAMVAGFFILKEPITVRSVIGTFVICVGVSIITFK